MPSSTRKGGIIGVGFGAQVHVPGFRSEGWEVAAICSRTHEKGTKPPLKPQSTGYIPTRWT